MKADILIVEDHPTMRATMRVILEQEEYSIREAAGGKEAMEAIAAQAPDIVFLDLNMPPPDGAEVLEWIKSNPDTAQVRVIIVTAQGEESRRDLIRAGADYFFVKPFSPLGLLATVDEVLAGKPPQG
jgi:two-component system, OmpR family, phosphate regulon response regulator PhoB